MSDEIVFYYDVVCPWAYLASTRIEAIGRRVGRTVRWEPVLLGGLLRHAGAQDDPNAAMSAARAEISRADLRRWAAWLDVPLRPPPGHPRRTVDAMRLCLCAPPGPTRIAVSAALYQAYWVQGRDVADPGVLADIATAHGIDPTAIRGDRARAALFRSTQAAASAGVFGVPTFLIDGKLAWGQDRLRRVQRWAGLDDPPPDGPIPDGPAGPDTHLQFIHDFASPFSYLAATRVEAVAAARGVEVRWCPILLGALFRDIGTPDVPLFEMHERKRRWVGEDLRDAAAELGVGFRFPSHFPIRSVLPLRVALVEPATTLPIYRAAWVDDRRIDLPEPLGAVLTDAGFDATALLTAAQTPAHKQALRDNTAHAREIGVCGVPTFEIVTEGRTHLVWGVDRLGLVDAILGGFDDAAR